MTAARSVHSSPRKLAAAFLALALTGCAAPPPVFPPIEPPLLWPREADPARFTYVGSIEGQADLKRPRSFWSWLADFWGGAEPPAKIRKAYGVAASPAGILYVADPEARVVHRFDLEGRDYRALTDAGDGRRFAAPIGLALSGDRLVVADRVLGTLTVLSPDGEPQSVLGAGELKSPVGVAIGPLTGRVYAVDVATHGVRAFDGEGNVVLSFGGRGRIPAKFNYPTHIACDSEENVYVTDALNARIQVFNRRARFLRSWGRRGDNPGEFSQPKGIACDRSGLVYVVDSHFENVQVFTAEGKFLLAFGQEGQGPGEFWLPVGIFVDTTDYIWVGDAFNSRVQVFRFLGDKEAEGMP